MLDGFLAAVTELQETDSNVSQRTADLPHAKDALTASCEQKVDSGTSADVRGGETDDRLEAIKKQAVTPCEKSVEVIRGGDSGDHISDKRKRYILYC